MTQIFDSYSSTKFALNFAQNDSEIFLIQFHIRHKNLYLISRNSPNMLFLILLSL